MTHRYRNGLRRFVALRAFSPELAMSVRVSFSSGQERLSSRVAHQGTVGMAAQVGPLRRHGRDGRSHDGTACRSREGTGISIAAASGRAHAGPHAALTIRMPLKFGHLRHCDITPGNTEPRPRPPKAVQAQSTSR
jgi:hypothetical protein